MMLVEGPLKLSVVEDTNSLNRELRLDFTNRFCKLELEQQSLEFENYVASLRRQIESNNQEDDDHRGMLLILQIAEQLVPYIQKGEIPLSETIVIEIRPDTSLSDIGRPRQN